MKNKKFLIAYRQLLTFLIIFFALYKILNKKIDQWYHSHNLLQLEFQVKICT